jgi:ABC-2 type transport system ATP-binding protein
MSVSASTVPIRVERVSKRFDQTVALDDVSLEIGQGEIFGLVGPNGAGKTTLIRTMLDIIKPDSGRVDIFGRTFQPGDRNRVGYLPEERGLYPRQEVGNVLEYLGSLKGMTPAAARAEGDRWLARFDLADAATKKVEQLSKGNQQKVQIAATLLARPPIAILDEPMSGLDPVSARVANTVVREYAAEGHTIVLSTHQMGLVESLCTRVFMINHGRSVLYGNLRDIKREHSTNAIRVLSNAAYESCPLVARVERAHAPDEAAAVYLHHAASGDAFLQWLVSSGARVERFERMDTPLEEIFVKVASQEVGLKADTPSTGEADSSRTGDSRLQ